MIEVYKIVNGIDKLSNIFFIDNDTRTRKHNFHLKIRKHVSKNIALNFFSRRVINYWNSLKPDIVNSNNLNIFKRKLDDYMNNEDFS